MMDTGHNVSGTGFSNNIGRIGGLPMYELKVSFSFGGKSEIDMDKGSYNKVAGEGDSSYELVF